MTEQTDGRKKRGAVPAPRGSDSRLPGAVINVEVADDERIQWSWTHWGPGQSAVTGYRIVKIKKPPADTGPENNPKS